MARISLGCYTIRVIDKSTGQCRPLGGHPLNDDLITIFTQYLNNRKAKYIIDDERQKLRRVLQTDRTAWLVNGIVETGEYGYTADLFNVGTRTVSYQRIGTDAEMMPFYFLAHLPSHRDEGVILLQRRSNIGIRTTFLNDFAKYFEESNNGVRVNVNPLVPPQLIEEYLQNGRLTNIRFIRFGLPSDLADAYDTGGHEEIGGTAELVVRPKRGQSIPLVNKIRDVLAGKIKIKEMVELTNHEYDNVKVEIDVMGSKKTLDLSDVMKMRTNVDITSDVRIKDDGHPEFDSIDTVAQNLMNSLLAQIGTG